MPQGGNKNDPLVGWKGENLAAPKRNMPVTQYDDDPIYRRSTPLQVLTPVQALPTRGPVPYYSP
jgi:hypothetical protein